MARKSKYFEPLAASVAAGKSIKAAAELANCSESQAYRVAKLPEFPARVSEIRTGVTDSIVGQLSAAATSAVTVLKDLMESEDEKGAVRVAAAKAVLANIGPAMDLHELRSRIDALEMGALE